MARQSSAGIVAPPGTRLPPRQNLGTTELMLSGAVGTVLGLVAARRGGLGGILLGFAGSALIARSATGAAPLQRMFGPDPDSQAAAKAENWGSAAVFSRAVTINAPRQQVYDRFRDFSKLPTFMVNLDSVTETDATHSRWTVAGSGGAKIEWDVVLTADAAGKLIVWESLPGAAVANKGRVEFRDAPGGRGTEVHATITYRPPGGTAGRLLAKLTQKEPGIEVRRDLKRFKSLIETGEIATNAPQGTKPKS